MPRSRLKAGCRRPTASISKRGGAHLQVRWPILLQHREDRGDVAYPNSEPVRPARDADQRAEDAMRRQLREGDRAHRPRLRAIPRLRLRNLVPGTAPRKVIFKRRNQRQRESRALCFVNGRLSWLVHAVTERCRSCVGSVKIGNKAWLKALT
jgi:hypothetical protein